MRRWVEVSLVFLGAMAAGASPAPADAPPGGAAKPLFQEGVVVTRVRWPVRVLEVKPTDAERCQKLTPADFEVREDDRPVRITAADRESGSTLFVVMIDSSATMTDSLEPIRKGTLKLASRLAEKDEVMVASFDEIVTVQTRPTRDLAEIERGVKAVQPTLRFTALYDALDQMTEELESVHARKAIIVITDGLDTASRTRDVRRILDRIAHSRDLRICTVLYASTDDMSVNGPLRILSQGSAGRFEWVPAEERVDDGVKAIGDAFGAIADWFDREVVLSYEPLTTPPPRTRNNVEPQRVDVKVKLRPGLPCKLKELLRERLIFPSTIAAQREE